MSYENAKEFLSRISTDPNAGEEVDAAYLDASIKLASKYGFNNSLSELQLAMADMASSGELPEAFLESTLVVSCRADREREALPSIRLNSLDVMFAEIVHPRFCE